MGIYLRIKRKLRFWLLRTLPACRETTIIISESMERKLTLRERFSLKVHLLVCMWCQWYMEHLRTMREVLRAQKSESVEINSLPGLSSEARERLKQKIQS